jgi:uncharacterized membrane protein
MLYLGFKTLHVLAVVMFLGNITTGIFWKEHADRTRDPRIIAHAIAGIIAADRLFTIPSVLLIVLAGVSTAMSGSLPLLRTGWIFWSLVLFTLSGIAFMGWLVPIQRKMHQLMRTGAESGSPDWDGYHRLSRAWGFWGAVALLLPLAAMVLMVIKPPIPGL